MLNLTNMILVIFILQISQIFSKLIPNGDVIVKVKGVFWQTIHHNKCFQPSLKKFKVLNKGEGCYTWKARNGNLCMSEDEKYCLGLKKGKFIMTDSGDGIQLEHDVENNVLRISGTDKCILGTKKYWAPYDCNNLIAVKDQDKCLTPKGKISKKMKKCVAYLNFSITNESNWCTCPKYGLPDNDSCPENEAIKCGSCIKGFKVENSLCVVDSDNGFVKVGDGTIIQENITLHQQYSLSFDMTLLETPPEYIERSILSINRDENDIYSHYPSIGISYESYEAKKGKLVEWIYLYFEATNCDQKSYNVWEESVPKKRFYEKLPADMFVKKTNNIRIEVLREVAEPWYKRGERKYHIISYLNNKQLDVSSFNNCDDGVGKMWAGRQYSENVEVPEVILGNIKYEKLEYNGLEDKDWAAIKDIEDEG